jgi:hypothetical protein
MKLTAKQFMGVAGIERNALKDAGRSGHAGYNNIHQWPLYKSLFCLFDGSALWDLGYKGR